MCGDDEEREIGGGLDETSWVMMRLYACRRREFVSKAELKLGGWRGDVPLQLHRQTRRR